MKKIDRTLHARLSALGQHIFNLAVWLLFGMFVTALFFIFLCLSVMVVGR